MKNYFQLQFKMTNRKWIAFGLSPIIGYLLLTIVFMLLSVSLFSKSEFAAYFYEAFCLFLMTKLSKRERNDFLKIAFSPADYLKIRMLENALIALPFICFLTYKQLFIFAFVLMGSAILMAFFNFNTAFKTSIPTPFSQKPFEFTVGFRKTFFIFPMAYFLTFMAVVVGNFNLGLFSMLAIFIISITYYTDPENEYYVWSFALSSKAFLIEKIKTGVYHSTLLAMPILITLILFFWEQWQALFSFLFLSYAYLITIILAKYTAYPNKTNLSESILVAISFVFPPILLGLIPFLYFKSIKRLAPFLKFNEENDSN